ncbi:DUF2867 domain-containing protein [Kitasatospora sp. NPDC101801]|uniref:DUF2867 domain-containing protein n=1 Tax=Kitasatospora sp. NPDC101801 TaxID=3364103 RepID=UPI0037FFFB1C
MAITRVVPVPADSVLPAQLPRIDYRDAYAVTLPPGSSADPEEWIRRLFTGSPSWIGRLMRLRDALVRPFGLRTGDRRSAAPFPTLLVTDREVVFGTDDRHLDFRASVHTDGSDLTVSTVVQFHNALGRAYFRPVRPFHHALIRSLLRHAAS